MLANKAFIKAFVLAAVAILAWHINAKAGIVEEGLVHYWSFDEATIKGETLEDIYGDNDGEIEGEPKVVEGKIGEAVEFDGATYVSLTPVSCLAKHSFTIQFWFKNYSDVRGYVFCQGIVAAGNNLLLHIGHLGSGRYKAGFWADDIDTHGEFRANEFFHLVTTYDKDKTTSRLYLNGEEIGVKEDCKGLLADVDKSDCEIGNMFQGGNRREFFSGVLDELGIYERALSEKEVKQNYESKVGFVADVKPVRKLSMTWGEIKSLK